MGFKRAPLQHVSRRNKPYHQVMRFAFAELVRGATHQHSTLLARAAPVWSDALCMQRRFQLHSHVEPQAPNPRPIWDPCRILTLPRHCYIAAFWWASKPSRLFWSHKCNRSPWFEAPRACGTMVRLHPLINTESPRLSFVINILHMGEGRDEP